MLCENCKKNEATIHITKIVNGVKREANLCEKCAREKQGLELNNDFFDVGAPFTFQNILGGIVDYISQSNNSDNNTELVCPNCGTTYSEFKKTGLLGCSQCYKSFNQTVMPIINRVQLGSEHKGKIPKKLGKGIIEKKRIVTLKEELQKAIAAEEYEKAAELRDKIKELQKEIG
ncbi:UvrB/UvrC motif-containing protein [Clostridium sp. JN-9]|uniref:UvrB/UvrC motif-containing protein n=1 Tax=Clostridium sp. JN-9 TaxID=2507159 RepID=UPI000FFE170B|nr:UvrB/UvrC motif-containing protein [Clostridium sp. JN-9]QAT41431.1 excinuclease [Clostridium sp. JN-9]